MKKRIAVFGAKGFPAFGGAAGANENIVNILKEHYEYTIYSVSTHTHLGTGPYNGYSQIVFKGTKGKRLNTFLYYVKSLFHALFIGDYDLVQVNHIASGFIVPFLRLKYRVVGTARGIIYKNDNKWNSIDKIALDLSAHFFFKFSNVVTTVSEPHIELFRKYTSKKVIYIPNGIKIQEEPKGKKECIPNESYLLFAANRIISLKGCHVLIDALHKLNYKQKVIVIGDTTHTPKYINELRMSSAGLNIEFRGLIKDKGLLFDYIRSAELFVFPSFTEGMSNMLLEVASLETPLICSDIPENVAVFNDTEVEFFKTGDSEDLASKINLFLSNRSLFKEKAHKALIKLNVKYRWEIVAAAYKKIYDSILINY